MSIYGYSRHLYPQSEEVLKTQHSIHASPETHIRFHPAYVFG